MDLRNLDVRQRIDQLGVIETVVRPSCLQDLRLLLEREVSVGVGGVDVLLIHIQDLIMGYDAGVAEVVDSSKLPL